MFKVIIRLCILYAISVAYLNAFQFISKKEPEMAFFIGLALAAAWYFVIRQFFKLLFADTSSSSQSQQNKPTASNRTEPFNRGISLDTDWPRREYEFNDDFHNTSSYDKENLYEERLYEENLEEKYYKKTKKTLRPDDNGNNISDKKEQSDGEIKYIKIIKPVKSRCNINDDYVTTSKKI